MREIKFRAWDKEHQVMYLPEYSEIRYMAVESLSDYCNSCGQKFDLK